MSTTSNPEEVVPENVRDEVFKQLKSMNKNNICIDCEKKNPKWASIHLGIQMCIDCAGKHRQYGVMYSFVKSTNLDVWNRKQLLFMQKGGNQRALDYLRKCGAISDTQRHIDYKSPIVQKYKAILTAEVEAQISGKPAVTTKVATTKKMDMFEEEEAQQKNQTIPKEIPKAEEVQGQEKGKKKKGKKKGGNKINLQDFDTMVFDDGVPIEEKEKIIKAYESSAKVAEQNEKVQSSKSGYEAYEGNTYTVEVEEKPRELSEQETKVKLEQLKQNQNLKSISSDSFKDTSANDQNLKSNLTKFSGSSSISSSAFFNDGEQHNEQEGSVTKIKDFVSDAGGKLYGKLASYWGKG